MSGFFFVPPDCWRWRRDSSGDQPYYSWLLRTAIAAKFWFCFCDFVILRIDKLVPSRVKQCSLFLCCVALFWMASEAPRGSSVFREDRLFKGFSYWSLKMVFLSMCKQWLCWRAGSSPASGYSQRFNKSLHQMTPELTLSVLLQSMSNCNCFLKKSLLDFFKWQSNNPSISICTSCTIPGWNFLTLSTLSAHLKVNLKQTTPYISIQLGLERHMMASLWQI